MLERLETIRSKSPSAVTQETWGLLLAYNLVRLEIERVAAELEVPPLRISFVAALREVAEQWHFATIVSPGTIPARLSTVADRLRQFLLPPRRPNRVFPCEIHSIAITENGASRSPKTIDGDHRCRFIAIGGPANRADP